MQPITLGFTWNPWSDFSLFSLPDTVTVLHVLLNAYSSNLTHAYLSLTQLLEPEPKPRPLTPSMHAPFWADWLIGIWKKAPELQVIIRGGLGILLSWNSNLLPNFFVFSFISEDIPLSPNHQCGCISLCSLTFSLSTLSKTCWIATSLLFFLASC